MIITQTELAEMIEGWLRDYFGRDKTGSRFALMMRYTLGEFIVERISSEANLGDKDKIEILLQNDERNFIDSYWRGKKIKASVVYIASHMANEILSGH